MGKLFEPELNSFSGYDVPPLTVAQPQAISVLIVQYRFDDIHLNSCVVVDIWQFPGKPPVILSSNLSCACSLE
jgi:hypothetical protein